MGVVRDYLRVNPSTRVTCRPLDEMPTSGAEEALMSNIAGGGIRFSHETGYPPGTSLALHMDVSGLPSSILALARVVWCEPDDEQPGRHEIGAELCWVGWDQREAQRQVAETLRASLGA